MFDNNNSIFDMKKEHRSPFFNPLNRLIHEYYFSKYSDISEHLLIKTEYMKTPLDII